MKIYTKTGDKGDTSLIGGKRIRKNDTQVEAYGTLDELNAQLGLLRANISDKSTNEDIFIIQKILFEIGVILSSDFSKKENFSSLDEKIFWLEKKIDEIQNQLPPIKEFIVPGENINSALCHVCRTVCRRFERRLTGLPFNSENLSEILIFTNRLSDYLFVLSRNIS